MQVQNTGGRSLNVRIDTVLLQALLTAHAAWLSVQRVGWHEFLRLAWERGADVLMREVEWAKDDQANDAKQAAEVGVVE